MRKVVLFIAMSLDGYIADANGSVDWLAAASDGGEDLYSAFIQEVDTVLMGYNTYRQIVTELSPGEWIYKGLTSYVFTHRPGPSDGAIRFTSESPCSLVVKWKQTPGKSIWVCGGAKIAQPLIQADLIDRYELSLLPILLGQGVRLFSGQGPTLPLRLVREQVQSGLIHAVYERPGRG